MALKDDVAFSQNEEYRDRLKGAMTKIAIDIQAEPLNTAQHTNRSNLAVNVLTAINVWVGRFALPACIGSALSMASTDTEFQNRVSAIWNAFFVTPGT